VKAHEMLRARLSAIAKLKVIKKTVDPVSGMSICVRRGVLSDTSEEEDGRALREWVQLEMSENMDAIIDALIATQETSLKMWERAAVDDIAANKAALLELEKYRG